jgi:hypothetical protein
MSIVRAGEEVCTYAEMVPEATPTSEGSTP